jgi:hypothetical protein
LFSETEVLRQLPIRVFFDKDRGNLIVRGPHLPPGFGYFCLGCGERVFTFLDLCFCDEAFGKQLLRQS